MKTLILFDGHRSHTSLTLTDWAKRNNVILFVLPPHSSHLTQPLDVGVFGPFKSMYYTECQSFMRRNPGMNISKYDIACLTRKPYMKAFSTENLVSAFRRTGIYPFVRTAITDSQIAPSLIYEKSNSTHQDKNCQDVLSPPATESYQQSNSFFQARKVTTVKAKPKKRFVPPF